MKSTEEKIKVMQAFLEGEIIRWKQNRFDEWYHSVNDERDSLAWDWEKNDYEIAPKEKKKLYIYCFKDLNDGMWTDSSDRFEDDEHFKQNWKEVIYFKRLDYTMIEVDQ